MSYQMMSWASEQATGSGTRKAVLMALANHANGHTGRCHPSVERLCEETEFGERAVRQALADLVDAGIIGRERRRRGDGSLGTYDYTFPAAHASPPAGGAARPPAGGAALNQEVPNQEESSSTAIAVDSRAPGETYDPLKLTKIDGRNLPYDALVAVTQADPMAESGRIAAALKVIRPLAVRDLNLQDEVRRRLHPVEWAERQIAGEIANRADMYRRRWPRVELTPTALAANWTRVALDNPGEPDLNSAYQVAQDAIDNARARRQP